MHLRRGTRLAFLALASALVLPHAFAGVIVVAASGGGSFTDLPAAVAAASDGDILLVRSGVYGGATISNKALDIVSDVGASVVVQGSLSIVNLAATRAVSLSGVTLRASTHLAPALALASNSGSVRIQGCTIAGFDQADCVTPNFVPGGVGLSIDNSLDVGLARCSVSGGQAGDAVGYSHIGNAGHALAVSGSRVALYENEVRGGRGGSIGGACGSLWYGYGGDGGDAIRATSCPTLFASGGWMLGGDGGAAELYAGCAGAGVRLVSTALQTLDSSISHGAYPMFGLAICNCYVDVCPSGAPWQTVIANARRLSATRVAREGAAVRIDVFGDPGDEVELTFASRGVFVPASAGVRLVRREKPGLVAQLGTIGPSGQLSTSWTQAELGPGVLGVRLFVQAEFQESSGRAITGPPATIVLLDSSL